MKILGRFLYFISQPKRDITDAAIAVFTAHKHSPTSSTHQTTLQGIVYQLDVALQNSVTQRAGIVFIYDMSNSKYSNFDYDLSQKILMLLKVSYFLVIIEEIVRRNYMDYIFDT